MKKLSARQIFVPFFLISITVSAYFYYSYEDGSTTTYPYYEVKQSYTVDNKNDSVETYTIVTKIIRVFRKKEDYHLSPDYYQKMITGRSINNITFEKIDSALMSEYDYASSKINKYKHIDQMVNKDYEKDEK